MASCGTSQHDRKSPYRRPYCETHPMNDKRPFTAHMALHANCRRPSDSKLPDIALLKTVRLADSDMSELSTLRDNENIS